MSTTRPSKTRRAAAHAVPAANALPVPGVPAFEDADAFYERLLDAHAGLTAAQSELLNARLILLLAHRVGDDRVLAQCIAAARDGVA
jgi:hypothetical protein